MKVYFDFETRSESDLKKVGADAYARHPSTEILCVALCKDGDRKDGGRAVVWHPFGEIDWFLTDPPEFKLLNELPPAVVSHVETGGAMVAHNAPFDFAIWNEVGVKKHGFPPLSLPQMDCTMARASSQALPASLANLGEALGVYVNKDKTGDSILRKMSLPPFEFTADLFAGLIKYCAYDTMALADIDSKLMPLTKKEREVWLANWRCNNRGLFLDRELIEAVGRANELENIALEDMAVSKGLSPSLLRSQKQFREWAYGQGVDLPDLNKKTLGALDIENPVVLEALELREQVCRSSIKKFEAMENHTCPDGRARGNHVYHRATTGRFAGSGVQVQNMPRPAVDDTDALAEDLLAGRALDGYGLPIKTLLSSLVRSCIVPEDGREFICADYASIEARVLFWLAKCQKGLRVFTEGLDLYCVTAEGIYEKPINKKDHPEERMIGKIASLSLGYQGAAGAFQGMCDAYGVDSSRLDVQEIVDGYRRTYKEVVDYWAQCEREAMQAIQSRGHRFGAFKYSDKMDALGAYLPSGRIILWNKPHIGQNKFGRDSVCYEGVGRNRKWMELNTYGGDLAQSITQGAARDLLAEALVRLDRNGWHPVLHVHDEIMCEEPVGAHTGAELEEIMCKLPSWAEGLPVQAEAWTGLRYRK